jgi:hypothetical protein
MKKIQLIALMLIFNHIAMEAITIEQPTRWKKIKNALTSKAARIIYGTVLVSCGAIGSIVLYNNWLKDQIEKGRNLAPIFDEELLASSIRNSYFTDEKNKIVEISRNRRDGYILKLKSYRKEDWPILKSLYADLKAYTAYQRSINQQPLEIYYLDSKSNFKLVEIIAWDEYEV